MGSIADALAGGSPYLKWENPGTSYEGSITDVQLRQARKYESTELDSWDDGTPKMQVVVTLQTALRDPERDEDDGIRSLSINLWSGQKKALLAACKAAGVSEPQAGQGFRATHVSGVGNAKSPRVFEYVITPAPSGVASALGATESAAQANPADMARQLLGAGADAATVAKATGLPEATVQALANAIAAQQ
jgi:hypothetical protein